MENYNISMVAANYKIIVLIVVVDMTVSKWMDWQLGGEFFKLKAYRVLEVELEEFVILTTQAWFLSSFLLFYWKKIISFFSNTFYGLFLFLYSPREICVT